MSDLLSLSDKIRKKQFRRIHFFFSSYRGESPTGKMYRLEEIYTHRLSLANTKNLKMNQLCDVLENKNIELPIRKDGGDCAMLVVIEFGGNEKDAKMHFSDSSDYIEYDNQYYGYPDRDLKSWLIFFCRKYFDSRY